MSGTEMAGLPRRLELLWQERESTGRRSRPGLNRERVVRAAIEVADAEGLGQLSMSRVAERLGFTTMSLYRHVRSKDELLTLMEEDAIGPPPPVAEVADGWRAGLRRWARAHLAIYRRHPWLLEIPISGPPLSPIGLDWFERGLLALRGTGLDAGEKVGVMQLVSGYVRTEAQLTRDLLAAESAAAVEGAEPIGYGPTVARLIDAERYPALAEIVATGALDEPGGYDEYTEESFEFGLRLLLDGVDSLIAARTADPVGGQGEQV